MSYTTYVFLYLHAISHLYFHGFAGLQFLRRRVTPMLEPWPCPSSPRPHARSSQTVEEEDGHMTQEFFPAGARTPPQAHERLNPFLPYSGYMPTLGSYRRSVARTTPPDGSTHTFGEATSLFSGAPTHQHRGHFNTQRHAQPSRPDRPLTHALTT